MSSYAAQLFLSIHASASVVWPISTELDGVWGVVMPHADIVEIRFGRALVLDVLRSHVARRVFWMCELLKLDSHCNFHWSWLSATVPGRAKLVVVGGTFSCCLEDSLTQNDGFGGIAKVKERKKETKSNDSPRGRWLKWHYHTSRGSRYREVASSILPSG